MVPIGADWWACWPECAKAAARTEVALDLRDHHHGDAGIRVGRDLHRLLRLFHRGLGLRKWFKGTATSGSAMEEGITFENFLPAGDDDRALRDGLHRADDARLHGRGHDRAIHPHRPAQGRELPNIVMKHALRNALIAPFTVIMLQFPWLLNGVVIVETLFNYKGFGWTLVQAAATTTSSSCWRFGRRSSWFW
jgi:hypothetical protein